MYSRKQSILLACAENTQYDLIIWCRFDMELRLINEPKYNPTKVIIPDVQTINTENIHLSMWHHMHSGYSDHWFFSNSENMRILAHMYDELYSYFVKNSTFDKYATELNLKNKTDGFGANSHTIHKHYFNTHFTNDTLCFLQFYND